MISLIELAVFFLRLARLSPVNQWITFFAHESMFHRLTYISTVALKAVRVVDSSQRRSRKEALRGGGEGGGGIFEPLRERPASPGVYQLGDWAFKILRQQTRMSRSLDVEASKELRIPLFIRKLLRRLRVVVVYLEKAAIVEYSILFVFFTGDDSEISTV